MSSGTGSTRLTASFTAVPFPRVAVSVFVVLSVRFVVLFWFSRCLTIAVFGGGCCRVRRGFLLVGGMRTENGIDGTAIQSVPSTTLLRRRNGAEATGLPGFAIWRCL